MKSLMYFILFSIVFVVSGCFDQSPEFGGPEVKYADKIGVYHYDNERPEQIKGDAEDRPGAVYIASAGRYLYADGTPITDGGLKVEELSMWATYYRSNSGTYPITDNQALTRSSLTTNDQGYILFAGKNTYWNADREQTGMKVKVPYKSGDEYEADFVFKFDTGKDLTQPYPYPPAPWKWKNHEVINANGYRVYVTGSYWLSCSIASGSVNGDDLNAPENQLPATASLSAADQAFLDNEENVQYDDMGVFAAQWARQAGSGGNGYLLQADAICALNHCDTESMKYHGTPYYCTMYYIGPYFSGVWPVEISGGDFEPFLIGARITHSNGNRHLLRTDGFLVVESERYTLTEDNRVIDIYDRWTATEDPNDPAVNIIADLFWEDFVDDPNAVEVNSEGVIASNLDPNRMTSCYVLPFSEGQAPSIAPLSITEVWLEDIPVADMDGNGIFNLNDLFGSPVLVETLSNTRALTAETTALTTANSLSTVSVASTSVETESDKEVTLETYLEILDFLSTLPADTNSQENLFALKMELIGQILESLQ